jgi:5-methyltetrahydrofolate--homocysteine methyltransferase
VSVPASGRLPEALARGPLVLDAAMGTRLIARGLSLDGDDPCLWNLAHPGHVSDIHRLDAAAGADAVVANTFGANRAWLSRHGRAGDVAAINRRAVELAREAIGPDRLVLGDIGPTASGDDEACREQATALIEAGVDALLFETHRADQAERALEWVRDLSDLPLLVSLVSWPDPIEEVARRLVDRGAWALGANCQAGMGPMVDLAERLHRTTGLTLLVKPSAGLPGDTQETPESFARAVPEWLARGVRMIGGCCGTTEAHVRALREAIGPGGTGR